MKNKVRKINIFLLALAVLAATLVASFPTQSASAAPVAPPKVAQAAKAITCWSQFYNRGIWFEIIMDRCAASQMIRDWNFAWRVLGPGFNKVFGTVGGSQVSSIVSRVLQSSFTNRVQWTLNQNKPIISLSSLWWNFPFPSVWSINTW